MVTVCVIMLYIQFVLHCANMSVYAVTANHEIHKLCFPQELPHVTGFEKIRLPCTQQQDTLFSIK